MAVSQGGSAFLKLSLDPPSPRGWRGGDRAGTPGSQARRPRAPSVPQAALHLTQSRKQHHPLVRASRAHTVPVPQRGPATPTDTRYTAADLTHTPARSPWRGASPLLPAATPSPQAAGGDAPRQDCAPAAPNRSRRDAQWQRELGVGAGGRKGRAQGLPGARRARTHCAGSARPGGGASALKGRVRSSDFPGRPAGNSVSGFAVVLGAIFFHWLWLVCAGDVATAETRMRFAKEVLCLEFVVKSINKYTLK